MLRAAYAEATTILEYGSGGSTVMAGEMTGKRVFSIESDADWVAMMQGYFAAHPPKSEVEVIHADIGPTKEWGHPANRRGWKKYAGYSLDIWEKSKMGQPDVVLVDGRFRVGCALAAAFHTKAPLLLFFDDYKRRDHYHVVEEFLGTPEKVGRMAVFEVTPTPFPVDRLGWVIRMMTRP